jgi:hypothetical protein
LRLFDRVKSWFGAKGEASIATPGPAAKRWTIGSSDAADRLEFGGAGTTAVASRAFSDDAADEGFSADGDVSPAGLRSAVLPAGRSVTLGTDPLSAAAGPESEAPAGPLLDPLDPAWMQSLEELPRRIAEAAGQGAAGLGVLKDIAGELNGHRQSTRALLLAVRRLPYLSAEQAEIARATNKLLERQLLILESTFDGVTSLRASFRSVEESSKRHVQALAQLETCHRNVLLEYQAMLVRAHRRLGWLAALGVILAAGALGAVAYVAWRVLLP